MRWPIAVTLPVGTPLQRVSVRPDGKARMMHRRRVSFVALALLTITLGLTVHRSGDALGPVARDMLGDALWAIMMCCWIGALLPARRVVQRSLAALMVCIGVELSQLVHWPALDAVRRTTLGHLVLGSGFDPRDLVSYALGVSVAVILEWSMTRAR